MDLTQEAKRVLELDEVMTRSSTPWSERLHANKELQHRSLDLLPKFAQEYLETREQCCYCGHGITYGIEKGQHDDGRVFHGKCFEGLAGLSRLTAENERLKRANELGAKWCIKEKEELRTNLTAAKDALRVAEARFESIVRTARSFRRKSAVHQVIFKDALDGQSAIQAALKEEE